MNSFKKNIVAMNISDKIVQKFSPKKRWSIRWDGHPRTPMVVQVTNVPRTHFQRILRTCGYTGGEEVVVLSKDEYERLKRRNLHPLNRFAFLTELLISARKHLYR